MIRAASDIRGRCLNHPHRRATRQCPRCKRGLCEDCLRDQQQDALCELCRAEVDELERIEHPPIEERVRRFGLSVRSFFIGLAIVLIVALPVGYFARQIAGRPITPEEFARMRYAAGGSFETPEGVNVLSTVLGARVLSATSWQPGYEPKNLINEYFGAGFPGWRSEDATLPQEIVAETGQPARIEKVILVQAVNEPHDTWARDVEVLVAFDAPDGTYTSVGTFRLVETDEQQRFTFAKTDARWIKLRILSNNGGAYTSLDELQAYVVPSGPFAVGRPGATPTR